LKKCSNTPQDIKDRVINDRKKMSDKEIAQKIKSGSFRKTTDVLNGNYQDELDKEKKKSRLEVEIDELEKTTNRTQAEQINLERKKNELEELNKKVIQPISSQENNNSENPPLLIAAGIVITILMGIGI
jgi:hypothetical protein